MRSKNTSTAGRIAALTKWAAQLDVGLASVAGEVAELRTHLGDSQHAAASPASVSSGVAESAQSIEDFVSLLDWVNWMARAFALSERFPSCWYQHEGAVVGTPSASPLAHRAATRRLERPLLDHPLGRCRLSNQ